MFYFGSRSGFEPLWKREGAWDSVSCDQADRVFTSFPCVAERPSLSGLLCHVFSHSHSAFDPWKFGDNHTNTGGNWEGDARFGGEEWSGSVASLLRSRFWDMSGEKNIVYFILFQNVSKHTVISCRFMLRKFMP